MLASLILARILEGDLRGVLGWSFTYSWTYGAKSSPLPERTPAEEADEADPYAGSDSEVEDEWDRGDVAAAAAE